jgi:hypothetical protein
VLLVQLIKETVEEMLQVPPQDSQLAVVEAQVHVGQMALDQAGVLAVMVFFLLLMDQALQELEEVAEKAMDQFQPAAAQV